MKQTYPIIADRYWELVAELSKRFGYPKALEEMVIYGRDDRGVKVVVTSDQVRVSWDVRPAHEDPAGFELRSKWFSTTTDSLKAKLEFCFPEPPYECDVSITPLLVFDATDAPFTFSMREHSLIGPILSIEYDPTELQSNRTTSLVDGEIEKLKPFLLDDLRERIAKVNRPADVCFVGSNSNLILNDKILDFCKRNGIVNITGRPYTYAQVQSSKSNDYSHKQKLFEAVTSQNLLSDHSTGALEVPNVFSVSFIIPFFNSRSSIERTIAGIVGQHGIQQFAGKIEVVIVDDGSDEQAIDAIGEHDWPLPIKVIRAEQNSGVSQARMLGMTHASGDVLCFIDSDVILSETYLVDHYIRNVILDDCVFVSFKENVANDFYQNTTSSSGISLPRPDISKDLRYSKKVRESAVGVYEVEQSVSVNILEDSHYFKNFHGARVFGVYDLASMITGHNFSGRRSTFEKASPFSKSFRGWGMEDVYLGLRMIATGTFIVPVLSCGTYHIEHEARSGSDELKQDEYCPFSNG